MIALPNAVHKKFTKLALIPLQLVREAVPPKKRRYRKRRRTWK